MIFQKLKQQKTKKKKLLNGQQDLMEQQNLLVRTLNVKNADKLPNTSLTVIGFAKNVDLNIRHLLLNLLKKLRQIQNLNLQMIL